MKKLALALVLSAACGDTTLFDFMERQPKYKPYSNNPFYADGRAMRTPPPGTIPRERTIGNAPLTTGKDAQGNDLTAIPIKLDRAGMELGRKRFEIHCAVCHGIAGDGISMVSTQMSLRPPPSLHTLQNPSAGHIYRVITEGFGIMPQYATSLDVRERWLVVAYIQALRRSQQGTLADAPKDIRDRLQAEKEHAQ